MLEDVSKTFDGFKAISNLNLYMDAGELRTIIGPNGAGKSTMLDLITGRTRPDKGKIEFGKDTDLTRLNEYQINRLGIGRKFQTPSVYIDHTVFENLLLSLPGTRSVWEALFSRVTSAQRERIQEILKIIRLEDKAEVKAGMGRNGVGKTTTLKCIVGLVKPVSGDIALVGKSLNGLRPDERARSGIGYVPQGRDIFPNLTVWENLLISLVVHGRKPNEQVDRVLQLFPVLKEMLKRKGGVLSGGQQQQLAIARALLTNPKVLILDEPTEGIQPNIIDQIGETLLKIRKTDGISILLVEQYLDFCLEVADRFYVMDRGAIVAEGPIANLDEGIVKKYLTV